MSEQPVVTSPPPSETAHGQPVVVAKDVTRRYGEGDAAVDALRGVDVRVPARAVRGRHGPVGLGQVDAHAPPRRARPAHRGHGQDRRHRDHGLRRQEADAPAPRQHRLRLPVLQPAADADGGAERRAAAHARRAQGRARRGCAQLLDAVGLARPAPPPARPSSPAASSSASPSRARCVNKPAVVFADEPTGNLDSKTSAEILALLRQSADEFGQTIVMVTHDAARRGDRRPRRSSSTDGLIVARRGASSTPTRSSTRSSRWSSDGSPRRSAGSCPQAPLALLTAFSIVLGVAMISGTFVVTGQIERVRRDLRRRERRNDVVVEPHDRFSDDNGRASRSRSRRRSWHASSRCRASRAATGEIDAPGSLVVSNGKARQPPGGAPPLVFSDAARALRSRQVHPRALAPRGAGEIALTRTRPTRARQGRRAGQVATLDGPQAPALRRHLQASARGLARRRARRARSAATMRSSWFGKPGKFTPIDVAGRRRASRRRARATASAPRSAAASRCRPARRGAEPTRRASPT